MNVTKNLTAPPVLIWFIQSAFDIIFQPDAYVQKFLSAERARVGINVLFLSTEMGGLFCNLYLFVRVSYFLRSMRHVKSHNRAIVFYNQYTFISVGLCLHLSVVGVLSCSLLLSSHLHLINFVNINKQEKKPKIDSMLSCNYVPFLRDALSNVYVYILLTLMVMYRRADIRSISKKRQSNQRTDLVERRRQAKVVLLHSLPWVLSLGLSLPLGLLDMRLDFRSLNPYKIMESSLSEELCLRRSSDSDIVHLCMWALQAWIPIVLCFSLCIIYSLKDKRVTNNRRNRRHSINTLDGKTNDSGMYSSTRTLYSLHNYKEEVIKLVKSSPIVFYFILVATLILKVPFSLTLFLDYCHFLVHSVFLFNQIVVILLKSLDYLHLALLPLFLTHSIVALVKNSIKINDIRQKLKKLTENDQYLKNSIQRYENNNQSDAEDSEKPFMLSTV